MAYNPIKKHFTYSIRDFYKDYRKRCFKDNQNPREYIKYRDFIYDVFAEMFSKILRDSWHFVLPFSLGEFYIKKTTLTGGSRKYQTYCKAASIKAGKAVFTMNNHTMRETFMFVWDRSYANFDNAKYYQFQILDGKEKQHERYNVGKKAISDFYFEMGRNPLIKMITPYSKPIRKLEEPTYEQT